MSLDRRLASSQALPDPLLNLFYSVKGQGEPGSRLTGDCISICSVNETC